MRVCDNDGLVLLLLLPRFVILTTLGHRRHINPVTTIWFSPSSCPSSLVSSRNVDDDDDDGLRTRCGGRVYRPQ